MYFIVFIDELTSKWNWILWDKDKEKEKSSNGFDTKSECIADIKSKDAWSGYPVKFRPDLQNLHVMA